MNTPQLQFLMLILAGWVNRSQQDVIKYLQEENRVLREQLGGKRVLFPDRQRCRLAAKAKAIGRKGLFEIGTLVTPDTLLRWYRPLISKKYDGSKSRTVGRPKTAAEIEQPDGKSMKQITRNLTDADDGFLNGVRYLIDDRDPLFTEAFSELLKSSGVKTVKLPARSPDLNATAERFVRSIKSECLAQIVPLGERQLRNAVREYTEHYHFERNHQGLDNQLIEKPSDEPDMDGAVEYQERMGGGLKYYYRRVA